MKVITYCNDESKLIYLKETEKMFNTKITYVIETGEWNGNITKIKKLNDLINTYDDNDIFIFIDAFDVIINSNYDEIIEKFKSYNCDLLFGGELNCYPDIFEKKFDKVLPNILPNNIKKKYINSGGYMGYVKSIKHLLKWINNNYKNNNPNNETRDQAFFFKYFLENHHNHNIKIDFYSKIFLNMYVISWDDIDFRNGRVYNNILKNNPCFIHFNGVSWKTDENKNIMQVFVDTLKNSNNNLNKIYNLKKYNQKYTICGYNTHTSWSQI